jgi:hypothetical protein
MKSILIKVHNGLVTFRFHSDIDYEFIAWEKRKYPSSCEKQQAFDFYNSTGWQKIVIGAVCKAEWKYSKGMGSIGADSFYYLVLPEQLKSDLPSYLSDEIRWIMQSNLLPEDLSEWQGNYLLFVSRNGRFALKHDDAITRLPDYKPEEEWRREMHESDAKEKRERKRKFKIRKIRESTAPISVPEQVTSKKSFWQKLLKK